MIDEPRSGQYLKSAVRRLRKRAGLTRSKLGPHTLTHSFATLELKNSRDMYGPASKLGPHSIRHTFATNYIRAGGNVRVLRRITGHSKLETTMIYVHLAGMDLKDDHSVYTPLRTLNVQIHKTYSFHVGPGCRFYRKRAA